MVNDEQQNYLAGRTMASAIFEQAALTFMVSKGICTAEEVEAVLSVSAAGFKAIEDRPGIANREAFRIARDHLNACAAQLPQIERAGAEAREKIARETAEETSEREDFILGKALAASLMSRVALRLIVENGLVSASAANELLDLAALGCAKEETDPEMKGLEAPYKQARKELDSLVDFLPIIEARQGDDHAEKALLATLTRMKRKGSLLGLL